MCFSQRRIGKQVEMVAGEIFKGELFTVFK